MTDELRQYYATRRAQHRDDTVPVDAPTRDTVAGYVAGHPEVYPLGYQGAHDARFTS